jgi:hypothetical protein
MTLTHFVSAACGGEICICGKPATHKLGEEIPHDEPCMSCGETWRYLNAGGKREVTDPGPCSSPYHCYRGMYRHNLTRYVCCFHWTLILGAATGCPLTDKDKHALETFRYAHQKDEGNIFALTVELLCPSCDGKLVLEGVNDINAIVGCTECGTGCHFSSKEKPDAT